MFSIWQSSSSLSTYLRSHNDQGSWALVTGASDGIGQGFAQELCARGFNVALHGRNPAKLERVKEQLLAANPASQIRIVTADAASFSPSDISSILRTLKDLPITVLINNVGGTGVLDANFKTFQTHTAEEIDGLINVNIRFTTHLTHALLPVLQRNEPSLIMNIGSQARMGTPFLSVYSGTKAYIYAFTKALSVELQAEGHKIEVLGIVVGSVQSQQNQTAQPSFFVPSSSDMAKSALAKIGSGRANVVGYFPHALQFIGYSLLPEKLLDSMTVKFLQPLAGRTERVW